MDVMLHNFILSTLIHH